MNSSKIAVDTDEVKDDHLERLKRLHLDFKKSTKPLSENLLHNLLDFKAPDAERPEMDFVLPGLLAGSVGLFVGAGGVGKSMLLMQIAAAIASGQDPKGLIPEVGDYELKAGKVVIVNVEDDRIVLTDRLFSVAEYHTERQWQAAAENLQISALAGKRLSIIDHRLQKNPLFSALEEEIIEMRPRLIILDTLNRLFGGASENDSGSAAVLMGHLESLAQASGASILVAHHASKQSLEAADASSAATRGSSALVDNSRFVCTLTNLSAKEVKARRIDEGLANDVVRLTFAKNNYGPRPKPQLLLRNAQGVLQTITDLATIAATPEGETAGEEAVNDNPKSGNITNAEDHLNEFNF